MNPSVAVSHCTWSHIGHCLKGAVKLPVKITDKAAKEVTRVIERIGTKFEKELCETVRHENGNCSVGIGVSYNSGKDLYVLTNGDGRTSEVPIENDNIAAALAWTRRVELEDWARDPFDNFSRYVVGGGLLMLATTLPQDIPWFVELPTVPTKSGKIRSSEGGYPLVGARRFTEITKLLMEKELPF